MATQSGGAATVLGFRAASCEEAMASHEGTIRRRSEPNGNAPSDLIELKLQMLRAFFRVTSRAVASASGQPAKTQRSRIETRAAMMSRISEPPLATPMARSMDHIARVCRAY